MADAVDVAAHTATMRAADLAFRRMGFADRIAAAALQELSAAWAAYLSAYERSVNRETMGTGADLHRIVELRRRVLQLAHSRTTVDEGGEDDEVAAAQTPDPVDEVADSPGRPWAVRPDMRLSGRWAAPHHLLWLPDAPATNVGPLDVYVWTTIPPDEMPGHALPTADVFLLARVDPQRYALQQRSGFLLRMRVPDGLAIDLSSYIGQLPARLRQRVSQAPDTFLLPLPWLSQVALTACYQLDGHGRCTRVTSMGGIGLTLCFKGADHGVPGLPTEIVRWPMRRAHRQAYLTIPDDSDWIAARLGAHPGWLPLDRRRSAAPRGYRLLTVDVARHSAIDLPRTLATLAGSPLVASGINAFIGVDLALPVREFAKTIITSEHGAGSPNRAPAGPSLRGLPLTAAIGLAQ